MSSLQGSLGEHAFAMECLKRSLVVAWPTASHMIYDIIVSSEERDYRVQVKGVTKPSTPGTYRVTTAHRNKLYDPKYVAYVVVWLADQDLWYVIPSKDIRTKTIYIKPSSVDCPWLQYEGAWHAFE